MKKSQLINAKGSNKTPEVLKEGNTMKTKMYMYALMIIIISLVISVQSQATIVLPSTLEYMTNHSDVVVVGNVVSKNSYLESGKIYTSVVIEIEEYIKNDSGESDSQIELKVLGGKVGDFAFEVDKAPVFEVGEKKMLFLIEADGTYVPYGFNYGVYDVTYSEAYGSEVVGGPYFNHNVHVDLETGQWVTDPHVQRQESGASQEIEKSSGAVTQRQGKIELELFIDKVRNIVR